ncbi:MAG: tRNA (adenosine(37)-N6)-threonylcarbamoyltransferase complex ATPase subunit type 1 TsaE [Bacteriovoracia bacterium]
MTKKTTCSNEEQTKKCASDLAEKCFRVEKSFVISLKGPLGAGKSTFARGFINKWLDLSCEPAAQTIVSPTFNIARVYGSKKPISHLDFYRLKDVSQLEEMGWEHYLFEHSCCLIEWFDLFPQIKAQVKKDLIIEVELEILTKNQREVTITTTEDFL